MRPPTKLREASGTIKMFPRILPQERRLKNRAVKYPNPKELERESRVELLISSHRNRSGERFFFFGTSALRLPSRDTARLRGIENTTIPKVAPKDSRKL